MRLLIIALTATALSATSLVCRVAPLSLYSVEHKNVKRIKSHRTYTIETVYRPDNSIDYDKILVNKQLYDLYSREANQPTSFIRGRYIVLVYKNHYYIRKVGTTHTARLNCLSK